jgi:molybdopterin/thiamine biosynthesis adenylyltransferase
MNVRQAQAEGLIDYSGQKDYYDPSYHGGSVSVVGAGGIGSPSVLGLARLGIPYIAVYDDDVVEPHNVTAQNYEISQVGMDKVDAITEQVNRVSVADIRPYTRRINEKARFTTDVVISAVDNMESRKEIYEAASKSPNTTHLIDGRLGGELIVCHVLKLSDKEHVEYYLSDDVMFDDSEVTSVACTARAVCDVGLAISALVVRSVRRILTAQPLEKQIVFNVNTLRMDAE